MSDQTSFFIAIPGDPQGTGIFGIGTTAEGAVSDAYAQSDSPAPFVTEATENGLTEWHVNTGAGENKYFTDEDEAQEYATRKGFVARPSTERLYRHIEKHGCDASLFRWTTNAAGLEDLEDEAA